MRSYHCACVGRLARVPGACAAWAVPASSSARWRRGDPYPRLSEGTSSDRVRGWVPAPRCSTRNQAEPGRVRWPPWWPSGKGRRSSARPLCGATPPSWITAGPRCRLCRGPRPASSASPASTASSSTCSPPSCSPCF